MTIEFPLTIEFPTEQAAVDLVAGVAEVALRGVRCNCTVARAGRAVTFFPESEEHAADIAVALVQRGVLMPTGEEARE
jgi:hypothetical protein